MLTAAKELKSPGGGCLGATPGTVCCLNAGGVGFPGSHLTDCLLHAGHEMVVCNNLSAERADKLTHRLGEERFCFIRQDVTEMPVRAGRAQRVDPLRRAGTLIADLRL